TTIAAATPGVVAVVAVVLVLALTAVSLFVGVIDISPRQVFTDARLREIFLISRVPRTAALILSGSAMAVGGLIMQHLTQNRFVAPTTAGTVDAAAVGMLTVTLVA